MSDKYGIMETDNLILQLQRLQFTDIEAPANNSLIEKLGQYYNHPLPAILVALYKNFNGGQPSINTYDTDYSIQYFYPLNNSLDIPWNIWVAIQNYADFLDRDTLPIAQDIYGSIIYLKWNNRQSEVWLFQYGAQVMDEVYNDEVLIKYIKLSDSLGAFLEKLNEE